jgi:hypothetical protein
LSKKVVCRSKTLHLYYDFNKDTAEKTAELLLQINAIKLNPGNPLRALMELSIYCDNRLIFLSSDKKLR